MFVFSKQYLKKDIELQPKYYQLKNMEWLSDTRPLLLFKLLHLISGSWNLEYSLSALYITLQMIYTTKLELSLLILYPSN